jgi:hypothetical protein
MTRFSSPQRLSLGITYQHVQKWYGYEMTPRVTCGDATLSEKDKNTRINMLVR